MAMNLKIFMMKKVLRQTLIILVQYGNYYPQVFLKECQYVEKKLIRYINDNLSDFSSDDDESDEEQAFLINTQVGCFLAYY